ncbi:hypothetical protein ATK17_1464 [Branchiibius hedensis]|uniref:Uncharacterized protein n=1 Tax=Branchiibius hedensis TaxID=672460 RepID=A0A2Y8ZP76_9MICO|nr:hypothetical protein [Branchiibius hedensis]PWJ25347.1 hypothetical protein ATK17_1464 [Branchiibius hedensis]SSA34161.1 hypothetical protein SAMN04489750_1464 [Branchiibius hedensis]
MADLLAGLANWWLQVLMVVVLALGVLAMVAVVVVPLVFRRTKPKTGGGSSQGSPLR